MQRPFLMIWSTFAFMGAVGLLYRALTASNSWFTGPAAGWVGAIGSILSVGAVGLVAIFQADVERQRDIWQEGERRRAEQRATAVQIRAIANVAKHSAQRISACSRDISNGDEKQALRVSAHFIPDFQASEARLASVEWRIASEGPVAGHLQTVQMWIGTAARRLEETTRRIAAGADVTSETSTLSSALEVFAEKINETAAQLAEYADELMPNALDT